MVEAAVYPAVQKGLQGAVEVVMVAGKQWRRLSCSMPSCKSVSLAAGTCRSQSCRHHMSMHTC